VSRCKSFSVLDAYRFGNPGRGDHNQSLAGPENFGKAVTAGAKDLKSTCSGTAAGSRGRRRAQRGGGTLTAFCVFGGEDAESRVVVEIVGFRVPTVADVNLVGVKPDGICFRSQAISERQAAGGLAGAFLGRRPCVSVQHLPRAPSGVVHEVRLVAPGGEEVMRPRVA
jgi:hypothetical protein